MWPESWSSIKWHHAQDVYFCRQFMYVGVDIQQLLSWQDVALYIFDCGCQPAWLRNTPEYHCCKCCCALLAHLAYNLDCAIMQT